MSSRQILLDQLTVLRMPAFRQALEEQLSTPHDAVHLRCMMSCRLRNG